MSNQQLSLAPAEPTVELGLVDGAIGDEPAAVMVIAAPTPAPELEQRNLFGEAERIAARAASASTRRQYASIFRAFGDWLAGELGRPPVVGDLDTDVIAAYARHLARAGGRGGRPAAPATTRVYVSMIRALARDLGREDQLQGVRVVGARHVAGRRGTSCARHVACGRRWRSRWGERDWGGAVMAEDVRGFCARLGVEIPDWATVEAAVSCFADPDAHKNQDRSKSCSVNLASGVSHCHCTMRENCARTSLGRTTPMCMDERPARGVTPAPFPTPLKPVPAGTRPRTTTARPPPQAPLVCGQTRGL